MFSIFFRNGTLLSVCGEEPIDLAAAWLFLDSQGTPLANSIRCNPFSIVKTSFRDKKKKHVKSGLCHLHYLATSFRLPSCVYIF